jgi:tetratricopeptide (TPR) repeat protein
LYAGLAPEFEGLHPPVGILFDKHMHLPLQAGLRSEKEVERFWGNKVMKVIRENPGGVAVHLFQRLMIFLNAREWSQEFDVYTYRAYSKFLSLPWVGFWLIGPFGILGLFLLRKPTENQLLLAGSTIITFLSIILFKASDRYRLPTTVLLTIFASLAVWQIWHWYKVKDRQRLILAFIGLAFFCLLSWPDWPNLEDRKIARHDFHIAIHDGEAGRLDEALVHFKESMQKFQWDPDSPYHIGRILLHKGHKEEGLEYLRQAIQREPNFPKAINEMARLHMVEGDLVSAEQRVKESLRLNPTGQDALLLLAGIYRRLGERQLELDTLEKAVLESKNHEAAVSVAERLIELKKYSKAVELYKLVMDAHDAGRELRVKAAMLAGITSSRFISGKKAGHEFYYVVVDDFGEFSFFDLQAKYLLGYITEEEFKKRMARGSEWEAAAAYIIGLARWVRGDLNGAAAAFRVCIGKNNPNGSIPPEKLPQKWAWADLRRIKDQLQ